METEFLPYSDGDVACEAYVAHDPSKRGPRPAVLVFHAWGGQDDFARAKAEHLARLGYLGVAIDMYGKGLRPETQETCAKAMTPFVQDRALLLRRASAAWNFARHHPLADTHRMGAIGFCFGGMCAHRTDHGFDGASEASLHLVVCVGGGHHGVPLVAEEQAMRLE